MKIALIQMLSTGDKLENLARMEEKAREAAGQGAELLVFPEAAMKAFQSGRLDEAAEPLDGHFGSTLTELAKQLGVTIVAGMFTPADKQGKFNRVYNTLIITNGVETKRYDKLHTFDAFGYRESDTVAPGTELVTWGDLGFATCYDIRFPEQFKALARQGAKLIVVSASWANGDDKLRQWRLLTNARALDSTSYVVAVGQAQPENPKEGDPTGIGHSALISPTGKRLVEAGFDEEIVLVEVELDDVDKARAALPVLQA
ncbi:carbon-nitrogen hydrolase family protein [Corynebacterium hindlerae]|uniref:carbon-nitrogen hydrolase family protein n=1 Tax=Corynebacterium hindlerae TaxID=699041 RepID=UPI0031B6FF7B